VETLDRLGYYFVSGVVAAQDYGVPQQRRRFVLVASQFGGMTLPAPTHGPKGTEQRRYRSVADAIRHLPAIAAGEQHVDDRFHWAANLSSTNLERIRCLKEGDGREKWPKHLWLKCHSDGYKGHTDVYGRIRWDAPASGLTTRCTSLSNGRFGHPEQDRAISIREAALLQTFPPDFVFHGSMRSMARQIGNAVPPRLAEVFGRYFVEHFKTHQEVSRG
jgi:DNA (cytosine-5)-methyltransferase 1